jgi:hypothetical protein
MFFSLFARTFGAKDKIVFVSHAVAETHRAAAVLANVEFGVAIVFAIQEAD